MMMKDGVNINLVYNSRQEGLLPAETITNIAAMPITLANLGNGTHMLTVPYDCNSNMMDKLMDVPGTCYEEITYYGSRCLPLMQWSIPDDKITAVRNLLEKNLGVTDVTLARLEVVVDNPLRERGDIYVDLDNARVYECTKMYINKVFPLYKDKEGQKVFYSLFKDITETEKGRMQLDGFAEIDKYGWM